jgi:hypothetical protein
VDTEPTGPRALTEEELALARRTRAGAPEPPPVPAPDVTPAPEPAPVVGGRPTLRPPATTGASANDTTGLTAATLLALFVTGNPPAGFVHVEGTGWRRLAGVGLIPVAAAARAAGGAALIRVGAGETDPVTEVYVW